MKGLKLFISSRFPIPLTLISMFTASLAFISCLSTVALIVKSPISFTPYGNGFTAILKSLEKYVFHFTAERKEFHLSLEFERDAILI